jgi:hypothetical protein
VGELLAAEAAGLVAGSWRELFDCPSAERLVRKRREAIEEEWERDFSRTRRLLGSTGLLEEETLLVLTLQSGLEAAASILGGSVTARLRAADDELSVRLRRNRRAVASSRRRKTLGRRRRTAVALVVANG